MSSNFCVSYLKIIFQISLATVAMSTWLTNTFFLFFLFTCDHFLRPSPQLFLGNSFGYIVFLHSKNVFHICTKHGTATNFVLYMDNKIGK